MAKVNVTGLHLQIEDVWEEEHNGESLYFDLNEIRSGEIDFDQPPSDLEANMKLKTLLTKDTDYAHMIRNSLIDSCEQLIREQKKNGTKAKGRTARLIADMTGISEFYIRMYLGKKNGRSKTCTKEEKERNEYISEIKDISRIMNRLCEAIENTEWDKEDIDYSLIQARASRLMDMLSIHFQTPKGGSS